MKYDDHLSHWWISQLIYAIHDAALAVPRKFYLTAPAEFFGAIATCS